MVTPRSPPALAGRVEELGEVLRRHHGLDGFTSAALPAQVRSQPLYFGVKPPVLG